MSVRNLFLIVLVLFAQGAAAAAAEQISYGRLGFYLQGGAAIGFENSKAFDQLEDALNAPLPALVTDIIGPVPGIPAGTTLDRIVIDVGVLAGFSAGAGYRLHPHLAVEAGFDWMRGDVDVGITVTVPGLGTDSASQKAAEYTIWTITGGMKAYALTGRIQPYGSVSLGVMRQEIEDSLSLGLSGSESAFVPRFGGGLDLYITRNLVVNADAGYLLSTGDLEDFDAISLRTGLSWRF